MRRLCDTCLYAYQINSACIKPSAARYHVITHQGKLLSLCHLHSNYIEGTKFTSRKKAQEELLKRSL